MKALVAVLAVSPDIFRAPSSGDRGGADRQSQSAMDAVRWLVQAMALRPGARTLFAMSPVVKT